MRGGREGAWGPEPSRGAWGVSPEQPGRPAVCHTASGAAGGARARSTCWPRGLPHRGSADGLVKPRAEPSGRHVEGQGAGIRGPPGGQSRARERPPIEARPHRRPPGGEAPPGSPRRSASSSEPPRGALSAAPASPAAFDDLASLRGGWRPLTERAEGPRPRHSSTNRRGDMCLRAGSCRARCSRTRCSAPQPGRPPIPHRPLRHRPG